MRPELAAPRAASSRRPRIAVSIAFEEPRDDRVLFRGKWLQYVEQSMLHAVTRAGGLPLMLPSHDSGAAELLDDCDGLLLTGGSDIAPESYGERARKPEWSGDRLRDAYELLLLQRARELDLAVLGVCRGCQLLAVASGGRLYQDILHEHDGAAVHRSQEQYDQLMHGVRIVAGTALARLYDGELQGWVNSVHHQAIRDPGAMRVAAVAPDGIIEAVEAPGERFELGVQWHPEWLPCEPVVEPVFRGFIDASTDSARIRSRSRGDSPGRREV